MRGLDDIIWRNASYLGYIQFRVECSTGRTPTDDLAIEQVEAIAKALREAAEKLGYVARIEHVKYPG